MEETQMTLTFEKLRKANLTRCDGTFHPINSWSPTDWACAMAGEAGEACNIIKKARRGDYGRVLVKTRDPFNPLQDLPQGSDRERFQVHLADELADVVIYVDLLAARCGIDLGEAVKRKFNIVSERKGASIRI